jgi:hypothetical protein
MSYNIRVKARETMSDTVDLTRQELLEYVSTLEALLAERDKVLNAIPECSIHGNQCIPHALDWIKTQQELSKLIDVGLLYQAGSALSEGHMSRRDNDLGEDLLILVKNIEELD